MTKVGITGGIGVGKSLIAAMVEALGYPVYYADNEAKRLMTDLPSLKNELTALLGQEAFADNTLNRIFIAKAIFENTELLEKTNALVHPAVKADFERWAEKNQAYPLLFLESALIYEARLQNTLDEVICVTAPLPIRVKRVMLRDACTEEAVLKRVAAQKKEEEETARKAGFIIRNDNQTPITPQLETILAKLKSC